MEEIHRYRYNFPRWNIKTFDEALDLNIDFLQGKIKSTPYHCSPVYDMNTTKLVYIHKKGRIFTDNGQSNECVYDKYSPKQKFFYHNVDDSRQDDCFILEERTYSMEQKSYLQGYMQQDNLHSFLTFLQKQKTIGYYLYDIPNEKEYYHGFENDKVWLTREKINNSEWENACGAGLMPDLTSYDLFLENTNEPLINFIIFSLEAGAELMEDVLISYIDQKD